MAPSRMGREDEVPESRGPGTLQFFVGRSFSAPVESQRIRSAGQEIEELRKVILRRENAMRGRLVLLTSAAFLMSIGIAAAQGGAPGGGGRGGAAQAPPPLKMMSPDITDGSKLADKFACAAGNDAVSPALQWSQAPRDT